MRLDGERNGASSNVSHCFKRFCSLVGVVTLDSKLRIRITRTSIRKLIFQLKIEFTRFNDLPNALAFSAIS